jgi:hypothetical protein
MTKAEGIIKDLMDTDWGNNNESQMKAVELLKGLALSDEDISNQFMKELSDASTSIGKKVLNTKEMKENFRQKASLLL